MAQRDPMPPDDETLAGLDLDLACPACGADLAGAEVFETYRLCPRCGRHFSLPARERLALLVDSESFVETNAALVSVEPLVFHDRLPYPDRLAEAQERTGLPETVITGTGTIGGQSAVLVVLDLAYLGGSIGVVAGEKITLAMEAAAGRRLPLIAVCSGGGARTQEGLLSLVQLAKTTAAATRLHRAGLPFISVLTHPTTGGVYAGLANQADVILAEPGAQIGFSVAREPSGADGPGTNTAEFLVAHGMIDAIVDRVRLRGTLTALLDLFANRGTPRPATVKPMVAGSGLPPWEAVGLARHPDRPTALDYIRRLLPDFVELHGDRVSGDDPAVVGGLGRLDGVSVAVVAQERGRGAEHERRRAGRTAPEGYRKAIRLMRLAGHLDLPLVTLVDTAGAASGADAEARGIGVVLSQAFGLMSILPVPIVSVVIGEGGSAGALALGIGDRILMQEHAVYSVVGPDGAGALLYRAADRAAEAGSSLNLTARDCQRLGVVDAVVPEPAPAAHADPEQAALQVRNAVLQALSDLGGMGTRRLLDARARKVRAMGQTTDEGREATWREIRELQELQHTLARSLGDLRDRWDHRNRVLPRLTRPRKLNLNLNLNLHRPDLSDLGGRLAALRASVTSHEGDRGWGPGDGDDAAQSATGTDQENGT